MEKRGVEKGFSLVELLVVIALIAVMLATSIPLLVQQMPKWHMNGTARDIKAKLMMARLRAIQENKSYGVRFTLGDIDKYGVVTFNGASWVEVGVVNEAASDINIVLADCIANRVEFDGSGAADGAGGCAASPELQAVVVNTKVGGLSRTILMDTSTGNMKIKID